MNLYDFIIKNIPVPFYKNSSVRVCLTYIKKISNTLAVADIIIWY